MHPDGPSPWGMDPGDWDAEAVRTTKPMLDRLFGPGRYLRVDATGWEHLPASPALVVSNHSGGTTIVDAFGFAWAWVDRFGPTRPLHAMVHDLLLANRFTGEAMAKVGALRACRTNARRALCDYGRDLVIYPGGDQDTWRPFRARHQVRFAGRTGYARLALELGVPVVPCAHAGAHESLIVLTTGRRFARLLGVHRIARADVFPIHLSLPWGLAVGPMPHLPLPVRLDYRLGPPVDFPVGYRPGRPPSATLVQKYDEAVRTSLQGLLDGLAASRAHFVRRWVRRLGLRT